MFIHSLTPFLSQALRQSLNHAANVARADKVPQLGLDYILLAALDDRTVSISLKEQKIDIDGLRRSLEESQQRKKFSYQHFQPMNASFSLPLDADARQVFDKIRESKNAEDPDKIWEINDIVDAIIGMLPDSQIAHILRLNGFGPDEGRPQRRQVIVSKGTLEDNSPDNTGDGWESYTIDITARARNDRIQKIEDRNNEISRVAEIMGRKNKNNAVLIGEPGVGKTAIVEGFADYLIRNNDNMPPHLKDARILSLDLGSLAASMRVGEFEKKLKSVVDGITNSPDRIILFVDEIHTLVGAGNQPGALDAANILKPALSNGDISCIGATTLAEYRKYFEKDQALARRFLPVKIDEPSLDSAARMAIARLPGYEEHHDLSYNNLYDHDTMHKVAKVSKMSGRFLPDCLLDLLDDAGARARTNGRKTVDFKFCLKFAAETLGFPPDHVDDDNLGFHLGLAARIKKNVFHQDQAVDTVCDALLRHRVGLADPRQPVGRFLFLGPTGVGKTELARQLAKELFGNETYMIRLDMSEYQDKHSVHRLFGAPPSYIGYEEGGQLTEAVWRKPYNIVLLDEIEKAHEEVFTALYQILDDGRMTDGKGRTVDFSHTIILMTSNAGIEILKRRAPGFFDTHEQAAITQERRQKQVLSQTFQDPFINRLDEVVLFNSLTPTQMTPIVEKQLAAREKRLHDRGRDIKLTATPQAVSFIAENGSDPQMGARPIDRFMKKWVDNELVSAFASDALGRGDTVLIDCNGQKLTFAFNAGAGSAAGLTGPKPKSRTPAPPPP